MRLGFDLSILRYPPAGTARYATELLRAMRATRPIHSIIEARGWPRRSGAGRRWRPFNFASDAGWLTVGANAAAAMGQIDAWYSPANVLPLALPRPTVVTIHDANVLESAGYDRAYATYARMVHARSGQRASAVIADSEHTRRRLIEAYELAPDRVVVAYPGIDHLAANIPSGPARSPTGSPYALFVGQTEPHKNLIRLVNAWARGVPPGLDLVIAGPPGRGEADLAAAIAASPAGKRITRVGLVSDNELARLYGGATCFVFPSLTEGFGLPPLEAMAQGVPTAVAAATSLPEVTAGAALTFDPLDEEAIADAVRTISEDGALRARLTIDGPRVAARYRWTATAETVWSVLERVTHG
jgi:glycosyltransferase involved in cell wall biosynthesis